VQLRERLSRRGFDDQAIEAALARCRTAGFLDDRLFAQLYVEGKRKAVGDARLVAELVRRGIDRHAARAAVEAAQRGEGARLDAAIDRLYRTRPSLDYPHAARALERLGFPAARIYRHLGARAALEFGTNEPSFEDSSATQA
jgi:regulatory protein